MTLKKNRKMFVFYSNPYHYISSSRPVRMLSLVVLLSSVAATLAVKCCAPPQFEGRIGFITAVIHNGKVQTSSVRKIKIKVWFYRIKTIYHIFFLYKIPFPNIIRLPKSLDPYHCIRPDRLAISYLSPIHSRKIVKNVKKLAHLSNTSVSNGKTQDLVISCCK